MQIKIGFTNPNINAEGIRVYRGTSPLDFANLPAALATIGPTATSYTDTTVLKDQTYYYVFEVFKGTDVVRTSNIKATATFYSGPGNQILKGGDLSAGYYGIVQASDFTDWDSFVGMVGVTLNTKSTTPTQDWLKFIYKGKTLFMPKQPIGTMTWNALYLKGLVYGVDGTGPRDYNVQTATNQLKIVTIQGMQFKVRLMRALPTAANLAAGYLAANNSGGFQVHYGTSWSADSWDTLYDLTGSEWTDLFIRLLSWTPTSQKGRNWDRLDENLAFNSSTNMVGMNQDGLMMEMDSTKLILTRGVVKNNSYHPGYTTASLAPATNFYWRPVLEMI